jgi:hypothetical protein
MSIGARLLSLLVERRGEDEGNSLRGMHHKEQSLPLSSCDAIVGEDNGRYWDPRPDKENTEQKIGDAIIWIVSRRHCRRKRSFAR